jgi:transforming growth factor-beta-induced protein
MKKYPRTIVVLIAMVLLGSGVGIALKALVFKKEKTVKTEIDNVETITDVVSQPKISTIGGIEIDRKQTLLENIKKIPILSTFKNSLEEEKVADLLNSGEPYTVFSPTDGAFELAKTSEVSKSVKIDTNFLKYHIVPGAYRTEQLTNRQILTTIEGDTLMVRKQDGKTLINNSIIETENASTQNGVIHVISSVLLPPIKTKIGKATVSSGDTIMASASKIETLSTFVKLVKAVKMEEVLNKYEPITVFAPSNKAFEQFDPNVETLLKSENEEYLKKLLLYHIAFSAFPTDQVTDGQTFTTLDTDSLTISKINGKIVVKPITPTTPENRLQIANSSQIYQLNGVMYIVDSVLRPVGQ